ASYADYDEPLPHDSLPSGRKSRRFETGMSAANAWSAMTPRSSLAATAVTDDERLWAAIAHASAWITLFGGIVSIGAIVPISIFIPLAIFFIFRKKSDYIAFHALQAFVFQLIGTVGAALLLTVGGVVWGIGMVVALVAVLVLVGFVLVPLWALVGLVGLLAIALMPLAMVLYATIGAIETFRGRDYRYPLVSRWIDRQLSGAARIPSRYI
ncbi:MAG: DUF4870 domain-containing protein, partial [Chloroflexota bacterium]|nr:DUF4870 domain-containing protein [Chloroflexota bacterium]